MGDVWEVPGALDDERLDRTLALLIGLSRRDVNRLVDESKVTVGGRVVTSRSRRVRAGERVSVSGPIGPVTPDAPDADASVEVVVVWSDDEVIVVDKPAGLVVHPGAGNRTGTLVHGLLARFPDLAVLAESAIGLAAIRSPTVRPTVIILTVPGSCTGSTRGHLDC